MSLEESSDPLSLRSDSVVECDERCVRDFFVFFWFLRLDLFVFDFVVRRCSSFDSDSEVSEETIPGGEVLSSVLSSDEDDPDSSSLEEDDVSSCSSSFFVFFGLGWFFLALSTSSTTGLFGVATGAVSWLSGVLLVPLLVESGVCVGSAIVSI